MSIQVLSEVWDKSQANATTLLVLLSLADTATDDGVCFPFVVTVAAKARCDEKTVRRTLRSLVEMRELDVWEWYDKNTGRKRNAYRVTVGDFIAYRGVEPDRIRERATVMRINVPTSVRRKVFERDGWRCCVCGGTAELVIDHVIPVTEGGGSEAENLQTLCGVHNAAKSDSLPNGLESRPGEMSAWESRADNPSEKRDEMSARRARDNGGKPLTHLGPVSNSFANAQELRRAGESSAPKLAMIGGRNLPFDALHEVDPGSSDKQIAVAVKAIREEFWREVLEEQGRRGPDVLDVPTDFEAFERALAAAIPHRAKIYADRWPGVELTATALAKHWRRMALPGPQREQDSYEMLQAIIESDE